MAAASFVNSKMVSFAFYYLVVLCLYSLSPISLARTLLEKATLLTPISYDMKFAINVNLSIQHFNYSVQSEVQFELKKITDALVMESTVPYIVFNNLTYGSPPQLLSVNHYRDGPYFTMHLRNYSSFRPGNYAVSAYLEGTITEFHGRGILYRTHKDGVTKHQTYSIWIDFFPASAKYTMLALNNVNAVCKISVSIEHPTGFHSYFIKQSKFKAHYGNTTRSKMYDFRLPLSFVVLYITQNVRITRGLRDRSVTVTAGRNQLGQFNKEFRFILDIFYDYVTQLSKTGPNIDLPLNYPDVFLHLQRSLISAGLTRHSTCVISLEFLVQNYKDIDTIHYFMSHCIAAYYVMTRRYPAYWNSFYIQMGLQEYYTIYMQQRRSFGGSIRGDLGFKSVMAFGQELDYSRPTMGALYKNPDLYKNINLNQDRALCFMNMLKHLIVSEPTSTFDQIVDRFLAGPTDLYNRQHFILAYQNGTNNQVFSNMERISKFFDVWTLQRGYPVVKVVREAHLLYFQQTTITSRVGMPFYIPLNVILEPRAKEQLDKTYPDLWLSTMKPRDTVYNISAASKWYLVNNQRAGYYRVLYDQWNYKMLRFELLRGDMHKIAPVSRGQLLDDALTLGYLARLDYVTVLELVEYLKHETDVVPWQMAAYQLQKLKFMLRFTPAYGIFRHFMKMLSRRFYRHNVEETNAYSSEALKWACFGQLGHCLRYTHKMFLEFLQQRAMFENLDKIICAGSISIDDDTFLYIKESLGHEVLGMHRDLYLTAMVCMTNYEYLIESLNVILRPTSLVAALLSASEKSRRMVQMLRNTDVGAKAVLDFLFQHPTLVLANIGEHETLNVMEKLGESLYKRSHQRKFRLVIMYLGLRNSGRVYSSMIYKRFWLHFHFGNVAKILANFEDVEVLEEYAKII